ncbi:MAG: hypothetical protein ABSB53_03100 [Nitrososphaerales archaeon]|jgi:hypothetical protein
MPRQPWVFECPVCEYDQVRVYTAKAGRTAHVVCGYCRTMVWWDPAPRMGEAIDLYNRFCDQVRTRMGSYVEIPSPIPQRPESLKVVQSRVAGGNVVFAAPLCLQHDFITAEPVMGFRGEMVAQMRICLKCGHAERENV